MPLVEIKVFEEELTPEQTKDLIEKVTEAVTDVISEHLRDVTWVIVNEIRSGNWSVGGRPLGVEDIRKIIESGETK